MALKAKTLVTVTAGLACLAVPVQAETPAKSSEQTKPVISKTTYWKKTALVPNESRKRKPLILVKSDAGQPFYNHTPPRKGLAKIRQGFDVSETYTITHKGRTYTNKIMKGGK